MRCADVHHNLCPIRYTVHAPLHAMVTWKKTNKKKEKKEDKMTLGKGTIPEAATSLTEPCPTLLSSIVLILVELSPKKQTFAYCK